MPSPLKIDFVSDISCPWCAIGLSSLEQALQRIAASDPEMADASLHFQPFELNPQMGPEGEDIVEHLAGKYGMDAGQVQENQQAIRARGEQVGFVFNMDRRSRIYNTFDAHRLLHWAEEEGRQRPLKHALLRAYFGEGRNPGDHAVLIECAQAAGLDAQGAREVLESGAYAEETRQRQRYYLEQGINSVPAVIINERYLIQGGQPVDVFERALRQVMQQQ